MSKQVTLNFEIDDVFGLYHTSTRSFYFDQIDRFEELSDKPIHKIFKQDKKMFMYWMDGYANILLFTKILTSFGYKIFILNDLAKEDPNEYVVLTDYAGSWSEFDEG